MPRSHQRQDLQLTVSARSLLGTGKVRSLGRSIVDQRGLLVAFREPLFFLLFNSFTVFSLSVCFLALSSKKKILSPLFDCLTISFLVLCCSLFANLPLCFRGVLLCCFYFHYYYGFFFCGFHLE